MEGSEIVQLMYLADLFKLLGDKTRLTIMALLYVQSLCVRDLVEILQVSQPSVSQHLAKLRIQGLVKETRQGAWVFYSINSEHMPIVKMILDQMPDMQHTIKTVQNEQVKAAY
ncbi:ArsR family transcriptional regulator [Brevibacillus fluminis]|uniref:ArsR family transcriptional regulator n=1 Tax=Brevibacillus fluminis TaxID=511487 RepID=A0A3M8DU95_9BACL|nr:metalloregulator ArsR/SmtB family transcription factor [Brevibacillus fluminis]RNB91484.1 ArsR family transcriptional regulator [Brevibacillus fluminis]